jgi:hypothetical protein
MDSSKKGGEKALPTRCSTLRHRTLPSELLEDLMATVLFFPHSVAPSSINPPSHDCQQHRPTDDGEQSTSSTVSSPPFTPSNSVIRISRDRLLQLMSAGRQCHRQLSLQLGRWLERELVLAERRRESLLRALVGNNISPFTAG